MRRFKQQMSDQECLDLLQTAPRGVLAVIGHGGYPHTVPINSLYHDGHIYSHCAKEGHKPDATRQCDKVSFCVLSQGVRESDRWWYHFQSVVCFGRIRKVRDTSRTDTLLRTLRRKYFPHYYDMQSDMARNAHRAIVLELHIEHITRKMSVKNNISCPICL